MGDLGTLGGLWSTGRDINASGQVAGTSTLDPEYNVRSHIFRTAPNQPINPATDDLGTLGQNEPRVMDMNDRGDIVGVFDLAPDYDRYTAFVALGSSLFYLNDLIDPASGWTLDEAFGINNSGQIVGVGSYNRDNHAFRLDPVPEPSSILLITGAGLLGCFRPRSPRLDMMSADATGDWNGMEQLEYVQQEEFFLAHRRQRGKIEKGCGLSRLGYINRRYAS